MAVGIIAEYNPFHNGHIYQLKKAKKLFPNEDIVIIMSVKYVQRGEIAIASFKERKKMALKYGATKIIKLPFKYSTQAAHIFAEGAIKIAHQNKIDKIFFGSESNDKKKLLTIAQIIYQNEKKYFEILKKYMKKGFSFPKASNLAINELSNKEIKTPNDILGLEYTKAIIKNNFNIKIFTLKRTIDFHSEKTNNKFASSTLIRKMIKENQDVSHYTPMKFNHKKIKYIENYYPRFQKIIKKTSATKLAKIKLISEGMENLFKKHINEKTYNSFIQKVNSKRYTSSRIKRTMLYVILKIKK